MQDFRFSVSQLKKFHASKAGRAGKYIMKINDDFQNDAWPLGLLFEEWLMTGKDDYSILEQHDIQDMEKLIIDYDNLKYNSKGLKFERGEAQYEVKGEFLGYDFLGYIDNLSDERVDDIKTSRYLNKKESNQINHWSGMNYYGEYELQLWCYMKFLGRKKGRILEVAKHKYKDGRRAHQIIEFHLSEERDKEMTEKWTKIADEMKGLRDAYVPLLSKGQQWLIK